MRSMIVSLILVLVSISPTNAAQASVQQRMQLSVVIANYIRDEAKSNEFKTEYVDLGAATIKGNWGLADWRSQDGKLHGQVSFFYLCDGWNVGKVILARHFRAQDLLGHALGAVPESTAVRLVADLKQLENQHIAFLRPARAEPSC